MCVLSMCLRTNEPWSQLHLLALVDDEVYHQRNGCQHGRHGGEGRGLAEIAAVDGGVRADGEGDGAVVVEYRGAGNLRHDGHPAQYRAGNDAGGHHRYCHLEEGLHLACAEAYGGLLNGHGYLYQRRRGGARRIRQTADDDRHYHYRQRARQHERLLAEAYHQRDCNDGAGHDVRQHGDGVNGIVPLDKNTLYDSQFYTKTPSKIFAMNYYLSQALYEGNYDICEEDIRQAGYLFLTEKINNYFDAGAKAPLAVYLSVAFDQIYLNFLREKKEEVKEYHDKVTLAGLNLSKDIFEEENMEFEYCDFIDSTLEKDDIKEIFKSLTDSKEIRISKEQGISRQAVNKKIHKNKQKVKSFFDMK